MTQRNKIVAYVVVVVLFIAFVLFLVLVLNKDTNEESIVESGGKTGGKEVNGENKNIEWKEIILEDSVSGDKFKIADFEDKVVLLESFAVWCPVCLAQQKEIQDLKNTSSNEMVYISINTDPNEDNEIVKEHKQKNNFDWQFTVALPDMTSALIDEFGVGVVNAPSAPVVLICNNESRLLKSGVKSANDLEEEIEKQCQL